MHITNILLAFDRESSGGAVAIAAGLSKRFDAHLTVAHFDGRTGTGQPAVADLVESLDRLGVAFDIRLEGLIAGAAIADSLLTMSEDLQSDLLVLGSRGRAAPLASLFGSVSREVARHMFPC